MQSHLFTTRYVGRQPNVLVGWGVAAAFALSIAFAFGWEFLVQNQNTYLAHALADLNPGFLARDWFVTETQPYHGLFRGFVVMVGTLLPLPVILPASLLVLIACPLVAFYGLIREVAPASPWFCFSVIGLWFLLGRTESVGGSYLFDNVLQASSFSVSFLLLAVVCFARRYLFLAGVLLALGGMFHGNYLLLSLPGFALALWFGNGGASGGPAGRVRQRFICFKSKAFWLDSCCLIGPPLLVLLASLPGLLTIMADPMAEKGAYIFTHIRSPWHYLPGQFLPDFIGLMCWCMAAVLSFRQVLAGSPVLCRLACVWASFTFLILMATLLTTWVFVQSVDQLFVWRLSPLVILLSAIFLSVAVVHERAPLKPVVSGLGYTVVLLVLVGARWKFDSLARFGGLDLLVVLLVLCVARCILSLTGFSVPRAAFATLGVLALLFFSIRGGVETYAYSTALHGVQDEDESALYRAVQSTSKDSVFLIPPELQGFRLRTLRAVVVDWKSTPYLGSMLVEWHRRVSDVAGTAVRSEWDAIEGYARMDWRRLRYLTNHYDVDYVVLDRTKARWLPEWDPVFENRQFVVYALDRIAE